VHVGFYLFISLFLANLKFYRDEFKLTFLALGNPTDTIGDLKKLIAAQTGTRLVQQALHDIFMLKSIQM
jgi:hypothetical protein